jgi:hypothetical protein
MSGAEQVPGTNLYVGQECLAYIGSDAMVVTIVDIIDMDYVDVYANGNTMRVRIDGLEEL